MKQSIGYIALVVQDYDKAIDFYVGTLGFTLMEDTYVEAQNKRSSILFTTVSSHFASFRRGRFIAAVDLMTSVPRPLDGNGTLARSIVAAISASTSGCANCLAASTRMKRACLPDPISSFFGSGN